jgi:hypothetical protein
MTDRNETVSNYEKYVKAGAVDLKTALELVYDLAMMEGQRQEREFRQKLSV